MASAAEAAPGRVTGFLLRNALANAGGMVAFLPLLSLLLPIKVELIAGEDRMSVLTAAVLVGALAASGSNLLFGWLSDIAVDRGIGRRPCVAFGLALTALSYALVALAGSPLTVVLSIGFFQFAVNALLGPMFAIMADEIPDSHKRTAGGLLALGPPFGAGVSTLVMLWPLTEAVRLAIVTAAVVVCITPLMLSRAMPAPERRESPAVAQMLRRDLIIAWSARFLAQVAGAIMAAYLVYYFQSVSPETPRETMVTMVASLLLLSNLLPVMISVPLGRWSDRIGRAKPFLLAAAFVAALGLIGMALAEDWTSAAIAFAVHSCGWSIFLALHAGFAMQLLPDPRRRGRDLGLLNLTNTLPQLVGPALTWLLATPHDFDPALLTAAGLTACGALAILAVKGRR